MNDELHVVLGASGGTGSALVEELIRRGHRVRAVSRGGGAPEGAEGMKADVSTPDGATAATAGAAVVYHAAQPAYTKWAEKFPAMTDNVIGGAAGRCHTPPAASSLSPSVTRARAMSGR